MRYSYSITIQTSEFFLEFLIRKCPIPKLKTVVDKLNLSSNAITEKKNINKTFI